MMNDWTSPGFNSQEMIRIIENRQGDIIGYIDVWDTIRPHVIKHIWGILHPDAWDDDLYRQMLSWAEERSRERIPLAPQSARVIMSQGISHKDVLRRRAMDAYGFELVRHFFRMEILLEGEQPQPSIPAGLTIKPINIQTELKDAVTAREDIFKDHWGYVEKPVDDLMEQWHHFIKSDKDFDPTLWFLAKSGNQIAGICRCSGVMVEDPNMGWVNELGVSRSWRRKGLGTALLQTAFKAFYQRGKKRVGLGVDAASLTNATRLYEKAGMHITQQYDTYEMELRSGENLSTM
jgi:GNAT superfamily N-acetyltransferase